MSLAIFLVYGPGRAHDREAQARNPGQTRPLETSVRDEDKRMGNRNDHNARETDGGNKPKPIPIREAVGGPGPRPSGRAQVRESSPTSRAPGLRGQRERPEGPRGKGASRNDERGRGRRPDRNGAASHREPTPRAPLERTALEDLPIRSFQHDGGEWLVRLGGRTATGSGRDPGAALLQLVFYTGVEPSVSCGEALVPGQSLEGLSEDRLAELLATMTRPVLRSNETSR